MIYFDDSTNAGNLPDQEYGVYYVDGLYANEAKVRARLPKAKLYGITVFGKTGKDIFACDCEKGDMTIDKAASWVEEQIRLGVDLIAVYADLSTWNTGLREKLAVHGNRIKRWVADYDGVKEVPAGFDAKQYQGGVTQKVDSNVANPDFFTPYKPPVVKPSGVARFSGTVDLANGVWTIKGELGTDVHFTGPRKAYSAEVQVDAGTGGGEWRIKGLPANAKPLGVFGEVWHAIFHR